MKNLKVLLALAIILVAVASSAFAQTIEASRAAIPFAFEIQGQKFPAGTYVIKTYESDPRFVFLESSNVKAGRALLPTTTVRSGDPATKLVFDANGETYVLRTIQKAAH